MKFCRYVETLVLSFADARPYFVDPNAKKNGQASKVSKFPNGAGVYAILRRVNLAEDDYTMYGVNTQSPIVLYVGKTTSRRSIAKRLADHFGGEKPNYQRSQFRKFLYQICQDHEAVKHILWSHDTLIATVEVPEGDEVISIVERLAMQVLQPRFNIKDR
jgi:hypothetical protein